MIPTKTRETRRMKIVKLPKNLERVYKENNCRECTVVVTRMDFAKILGKFTKVKIQYESSSTPTSKKSYNQVSPNTRLKSNENGLVQVLRNTQTSQKSKKSTTLEASKSATKNILKENNRLKRNNTASETINDDFDNIKLITSKIKHYGIVFESPKMNKNDFVSTISLENLVPYINDSILPSENWCIDYINKNGEPSDDKVYKRIAAELEDLMYNEKSTSVTTKVEKTDEFPSIMDILNDNPKEDSNKNEQNNSVNLESNDVEAMLLGKTDYNKSTPMDVDSTDVSSFLTGAEPINDMQKIDNRDDTKKPSENPNVMDESPESPSILEEIVKKESKLQLQTDEVLPEDSTLDAKCLTLNGTTSTGVVSKIDENDNTNANNINDSPVSRKGVTQVMFKKNVNGTCQKSVICPKNLKYSISMLGKSVELLGAPKYISSIEDLRVLLQIVDESNLDSLYLLY